MIGGSRVSIQAKIYFSFIDGLFAIFSREGKITKGATRVVSMRTNIDNFNLYWAEKKIALKKKHKSCKLS